MKEVGTLAEIGAQVGDVVASMSSRSSSFMVDGFMLEDFTYGDYYIISRAQPTGPVITETVTTKRIVPGVYGRVKIAKADDGCDIFVSPLHTDNRADIIAAIDTLQQIADAMEDQ